MIISSILNIIPFMFTHEFREVIFNLDVQKKALLR